MRKDEFIEFVKRPETLSCDKTPDLQELVQLFPWFQTAHILLCRNLKVCGNIGFEEQLRLTAAYAADRVRLHQIVMETESRPGDDKVLPMQPTPSEPSSFTRTEQQENENSHEPEPAKIDETQTKEVQKNDDNAPVTPAQPEDDLLHKQILSHAISNSNLLGELEENEDSREIPEHIHLPKPGPVDEDENLPADVEKDNADDFDETTEHSFTEWLHHFGDDKEEFNEQEEEIAFNVKEDKKEILISSRTKVSFYNPTEMAKLSVKEDDDLVTETLARIYAQQGNFEKAIKAYNKLSLKYPEKKVYFASQIQELEKRL